MKKSDARTSLEIYKRFARQTEETISFLDRARRLQHELSISIPSVKHVTIIINLYRSLLIFVRIGAVILGSSFTRVLG